MLSASGPWPRGVRAAGTSGIWANTASHRGDCGDPLCVRCALPCRLVACSGPPRPHPAPAPALLGFLHSYRQPSSNVFGSVPPRRHRAAVAALGNEARERAGETKRRGARRDSSRRQRGRAECISLRSSTNGQRTPRWEVTEPRFDTAAPSLSLTNCWERGSPEHGAEGRERGVAAEGRYEQRGCTPRRSERTADVPQSPRCDAVFAQLPRYARCAHTPTKRPAAGQHPSRPERNHAMKSATPS